MTGFKTPLHGRTHAAMGSDPIPGIGDDIRFDTYPQTGNWLYVQTDDEMAVGGSPNGNGIELNDNSGGGAFMGAFGGGDVHLRATGGGLIYLQSADDISLAATDVLRLGTLGAIVMTAEADSTLDVTGDFVATTIGGITLTAGTSGLSSPDGVLQLNGYDRVELFCSIGEIEIAVSNAGSAGDHSLLVSSLAASPNELFRVDSAGHIFMRHLPTSNPGTGDGQLWKNGQVVTVTT